MSSAVSVQEKWIQVNGMNIRLLRAGKGDPFLWLHGANGGHWNPFLERMAQSFDVLAPDHPGFGRSDHSEEIDSVLDLAFYYRDFLDVLGLEQVFVCGNSLGGWIGLELALIQSHRIKKLIVCDTAGVHHPGEEGLDMFITSPAELAQALFYDAAKAPLSPQGEEAELIMLKNRKMFARLVWEQPFNPKLLKRLRGLYVETLIVWGRDDRLIPVHVSERLVQALPQSKLCIIDQCGHLPYLEQTEKLSQAVLSFLTGS
jgi:pimeloyl-ACP methyl ester carboxylesterase